MNTTLFAAWLLRLQRALHSFGNGVSHKNGALGAHPSFTKIYRKQERRFFRFPMFSGAVDLDKLADQTDILFLLAGYRFHGCDHAQFLFAQT